MLKFIHRRRIQRLQKEEDIYASTVFLNPVLQRFSTILPFTQYAARPFVIATLFNEIQINERQNYLEFGLGLSSLMLAKAIQINNLDTKIYSVEHDEEWIDKVKATIEKESLGGIIEIAQSPMVKTITALGEIEWYDKDILVDKLKGIKYDLIYVDAPPGLRSYNRYLALPFLKNNNQHNQKFAIYLDDAGRKHEKRIIAQWEKSYNIQFEYILDHLARYIEGDSLKIKLTNSK
jgi:hypothetical protein